MVSKNLLTAIGKQISIIRNRANLTQKRLGEKCGFYQGTEGIEGWITKIEKGEKNVSIEDLERIAAACGHTVEIRFKSLRLPSRPPMLTEDQRLTDQFARLRLQGKL